MKRTAILLDENSKEIFRGNPADLPVRFLSEDGNLIEHSMTAALDVGTPINDEWGNDLKLYDEGYSQPSSPATGTIRITWYTDDGQDCFLGAFRVTSETTAELLSICGENYEITREEIEEFVARYEELARIETAPFLMPTDLYDDFQEEES